MTEAQRIRDNLRRAGLTASAIDAVWPAWWSDDAELSTSATAELRYSLARRLGLSPASLFDDQPVFVWSDDTKFKNLGATSDREADVLSSFTVAVGRCAVAATEDTGNSPAGVNALTLRDVVLSDRAYVDLEGVLALCWMLAIPVFYLDVFPLQYKRMHSAAARIRDRHAILLGQQSNYPAQVAYYVAHELGHIALGHTEGSAALLDIDDPLTANPAAIDEDEAAADRFALELLTGRADPDISWTVDDFTSAQLAKAVKVESTQVGIDPGVLALCTGHRSGRWAQAYGAQKALRLDRSTLRVDINTLADSQFNWSALPADSREFLAVATGIVRGDRDE